MSSGIYQIRCRTNDKRYVGSAVNFGARWSVHRHLLRGGKHNSIHLQRAALFKSGANHPWYGRSHSDESKRKLSLAKSDQFEQMAHDGLVIKVWRTAREAAAALGLKAADTIYRSALHGRVAAGFRWRRVQDRAIVS